MASDNVARAKALNWDEHVSTLPKEGAVYPKGQDKADQIARLNAALAKVKIKQVA